MARSDYAEKPRVSYSEIAVHSKSSFAGQSVKSPVFNVFNTNRGPIPDLRRKLLAAKGQTHQGRNMDLSEFTSNYAHLGDDELLCLWADRKTLVPEASVALDSELQRRGLNKQNATEVKKRLDALAAREEKGSLVNHKVLVANYDRNMRQFVGWEEPKFYPPYVPKNDIRNIFAYVGHKYRVWKAFRDHTGQWPVFSICFHFLSWSAVIGFTLGGLIWVRKREGGWSLVAVEKIGAAGPLGKPTALARSADLQYSRVGG